MLEKPCLLDSGPFASVSKHPISSSGSPKSSGAAFFSVVVQGKLPGIRQLLEEGAKLVDSKTMPWAKSDASESSSEQESASHWSNHILHADGLT